ncbi:efflux RND transporter periplasmic adaptor subunit [Croceibacterium sp. LX-88]|jgi:RND family efflux transporter MFP subunit|uniref:Efflux RND transporter periplasmic adaptor subunit n=1 Tax=Croceibacterium selenioxidans TaxID=2838833 RepID=A0ABS5W783_9SPHN|nr:efflux RND transporter periplasmic adaptor subunit [Croceibacterium selenioxidans]MBT2135202.1 efflux RND transporter periplasmic adaptor subunit [Croceibacterium selenioxidans]
MNYEAKVADLSGAPEVQVEDFDSGSRRTRKRWTVVAVIVLAALLIGGAVALMGGEEESPFPAPDGEQVPTVTVVAPGRSNVAGTINATGTLAARRELPVGVVGEGGRVVSVLVEPGDWVGAGQVLAVIDRSVQTEQARSSAASVDVAKADAQLAQSNLDRALQLVDRGFISKADVDRLTATRDAARARVKVAEAQYRELLARNARLNIVAPDAGLVLERNVEPAQVVGSGSGVLFSIARGGQMELLANLSESDLAAVSVGSAATVVPVGSGKSFVGQIWQLAPVIDAQNRQGVARIALPYDKAIRPGGFASAQISRGQVVAPRLPESAIQSDEKGSFVFVVNKDSRVERRAVTTGVVTEEGITVTSGLSGSEKVVERAGGFLNPGDKVNAVAANRGNQAPGQ